MKNKVMEAYAKLAADYEKHVDTESGTNAYYERRRWLRGDVGVRVIAQGAGVDRKTAKRYIDVAQELGLQRSGGEEQLTEEFIGRVRQVVRPSRAGEHGTSWELLARTKSRSSRGWMTISPSPRSATCSFVVASMFPGARCNDSAPRSTG